MKSAIVFAFVLAPVLGHRLRGSPGAVTGEEGAVSINAGEGASGASAAMAALRNLMQSVATANGGSGTAAAPIGFETGGGASAGQEKESQARKTLEEAQLINEAAANFREDAETKEIEAGIRAAMASPSQVGSLPPITAGGDISGAASFMHSQYGKASFLRGGTMANGFAVRNALFTTQLMRMPSQANVNVITKENQSTASAEAVALANASRAQYLRANFERGLNALQH